MEKTNQPLSKTCSSCGLQKPLAAFLQLAGSQGTTYGTICASCRKTQADHPHLPKEPEDSTRSDTGHKIDNKAKVAGDIDKKQLRVKIDEEYHEERDLNEIELVKEQEKSITHTKEEKKHRDSYLERSSFLSPNKSIDAQRASESRKQAERTTQETFLQQETGKQEQAIKEEKIKTGIDLTAPYIPSQTGEIKHQSAVFKQFKAWLGASAPIVKNTEQVMKNQQPNANKQTPEEFIENKWGPNSRGRR